MVFSAPLRLCVKQTPPPHAIIRLSMASAEENLAELSAEPNLQYSLSPAYPRAFLRHGQHAWAAIACPPQSDAGAVVSFALIWLDYLRARESRVTVAGLAIYVPAGRERSA